MTASVLLVEDHNLIAQGIAIALRAEGLIAVVASDLEPEEVLSAATEMRPDVVLLDLHFDAIGSTGLPLVAPLTASGARVVILSGTTDRLELAACVEAGAFGLANKSETFDSVLAKVLAAASGTPVLSDGQRQRLLGELADYRMSQTELLAPFAALSEREAETLVALMDGRQAEAIAATDFVSLTTVRSHIRSILRKLDVSSQLAAVALARRVGWAGAAIRQH